ncbi:MAG: imelysin family protein [Bacteroidota bacterium]
MKKRFLFAFLIICFVCCKKKSEQENKPEPVDSYDKQALLVNISNNVILPAYNSFKISLDSLINAYNTFKTSGLQADYQIVKQKLNVAYIKYQTISPFEFGPAESIIVRMNFNVFPTDTIQIRSNISAATYNLDAANNLDAKGFPALDFLFYGNNQTEATCISQFTTSANLRQYVSDVLNDMSTKSNSVISNWNSSYKNTFVNSLGTDMGSSIGFLINQLNFELDYLKNAKIGTPLGKKTLGFPVPEKCEAYFGGQSVRYAIETLNAIENVYLGRGPSGNNGEGFDNYLVHLNAQYNGGSLNDAINAQFSVTKTKLAAVANPLSTQVTTNANVIDAAYTELVKLLVLLKTDLPSNLGVVITYQDGDGD